jgi:carbamoyltransferase
LIILGLNAFHGDSSACLVIDGQLVAAAEEERFRRIKHWAGLPTESIKYCLHAAGLSMRDVDHIAINRNPAANSFRKAIFALSRKFDLAAVADRLKNASKVRGVREDIAIALGMPTSEISAQVHNIEHHLAHLASAFFVSPYREAAVVSVDGFGDFASTAWGVGQDSRIDIKQRTHFPHSLGLFYLALTQYLGFPNYGDEYKVMGLAPYGRATEMSKMRQVVRLLSDGRFELNLDYFLHHSDGVAMTWDNGEPTVGRVFSSMLEELFGPARRKNEPLASHHWDIAASTQGMYEEALFHLLEYAHRKTNVSTLALAGGCAMNSVANGKIFDRSKFTEVYIQSAPGDAGGAIGAAYALWNQELGRPRAFEMKHAYWGPEFTREEIEILLQQRVAELDAQICCVKYVPNESELCARTAQAIADGKVIGWFQGRMEWGPRALGNRSILGDPRRADMKDILNIKIKRRESFRPFAPSILREYVKEWFETDYDVPFMLQVFQIVERKRSEIPAVTHVNGSGRLQTVTKEQNQRYYSLIEAFRSLTDVPMLLNTSFNENEPVVCRPTEALDCFLRTKMDVLVIGDYFIERQEL